VSEIPGKGDLRYPTVGGTILIGALLAAGAALVNVWLDWGIWPWIVAAVIFLYLLAVNLWTVKYGPSARRAVGDLPPRDDD
jgi:hypothetical protein